MPSSYNGIVRCMCFLTRVCHLSLLKMVYSRLLPKAANLVLFFFLERSKSTNYFETPSDMHATRQGILNFIKKFKSDGTIGRKPGVDASGR